MKHLLIGVLLLCAATAYAQQSPSATSSSVGTSANGLSAIYTDGKCHFRLKKVPGQGYNDGSYMFYANDSDNPNGWGFGFGCYASASQDDIDDQVGVKLIDGKWIDRNSGNPFDPDQHLKVSQFSGKNWTGTVMTYDDTTGDESTRGSNFHFCLVETHGPQALCGQVQGLPVGPSTSPAATKMTQKILAVLKTVVFVDQPANPPTSLSASVGH